MKIDTDRVKKLTLSKIRQDKKKKVLSFQSRYTKAACTIIAAFVIASGSAYAFTEVGFQNLISQITGVQQTKILMVGEAISNKDYELRVHEIVTDSYVGKVVVSIEALRAKSKENFNNYRIDLNHIGSGYGLRELNEYRETYIRYYEIGFSGATHQYSNNDGKLQFSVKGMKQVIEVPLSPTIDVIDMELPKDNSNAYQYTFYKLHLSEIGLTLEGTDTRNMERENWYHIELLFADGRKELLQKKMNENVSGKTITDTSIDGDLFSGSSSYHSGDDGHHVNISITFSKILPLDTIKQVVINDIAYDIVR